MIATASGRPSIIGRVLVLTAMLVSVALSILTCSDESAPTFSSPAMGTVWEIRTSGVDDTLNAVIWNGQMYVTVGGTSIYTSPDARTWELRYTGAPGSLRDIVWTGSHFIAVGGHAILVSEDGVSWNLNTTAGLLNGVGANDTHAIAVGDSGLVLVSRDLQTWYRSIYAGDQLRAIVWAPDFRYAVGQDRRTGAFVLCGEDIVAHCTAFNMTLSYTRTSWYGSYRDLCPIDSVVILVGDGMRAIDRVGDQLVAVGNYGDAVVMRHAPTPWEPNRTIGGTYRTGLRGTLYGVTGAGNGCVAVGVRGTVVTSPPNRIR